MRNAIHIFSLTLLMSLTQMSWGMGRSPSGYTLIIAPDKPYTLQISNDVSQHYPVLLVSYETPGNPGSPFLHVLHENRWIRVPADQFQSGAFLQQRPTRTIVVGDDNPMTESLINTVQAWSVQVVNHPSSNNTELLNAYGQDFQFNKRTWRWFANKYNLSLDDRNREMNHQSWYDQPYVDETKMAPPPSIRSTSSAPAVSTPRPESSLAKQPAPATIPEATPEIKDLEVAPKPSAPPQFRGWQDKN